MTMHEGAIGDTQSDSPRAKPPLILWLPRIHILIFHIYLGTECSETGKELLVQLWGIQLCITYRYLMSDKYAVV